MASEQAVWGIEIGQCALKAVRLRQAEDGKGVEILAFDYIEHPKILSQPDADPDALSREALQQFLSRNSVKGDRLCIGVPGQSGLARFIKLPPVEQSRIPEIVKYEARQQIPFALEEVVWDFQRIGQADEAEGFALETEIGLFAMKRDLIYRFMNPFREANLEIDYIQMRPLAVYNFAAFDQISAEATEDPAAVDKAESEYQREELVETKKEAAPPPPGFTVLLDMGADNSDLVITDAVRIWQRNLPIGGNHFTRALTKELKLTFAKAEHLKKNATKAQDPRAVFQAMRPVFNDLVSEIQRSIGYFSSVHRQSKITRIIGMGNAFKLPGLQKFLAQNLQYEVDKVETFKRLKGSSVLSAPAFQENVLSFTVCYGLALQGLKLATIGTNLLPPEITQTRMIRRQKPWWLSAAAIVLFACTWLFLGSWAQLDAVSNAAFAPAEDNAKMAQATQKEKKEKFEAAKSAWSTVEKNGYALTGSVEKRFQWLEVLKAINDALPVNADNSTEARKQLGQLSELEITSMAVSYKDDLKVEWYDKEIDVPTNGWARFTVEPYDKNPPPSGFGWVITLTGFHLNNDGTKFLRETLSASNGGLKSAKARSYGISCVSISKPKEYTDWNPWTEKAASGGDQGATSGASSASGNPTNSGAGMGGGNDSAAGAGTPSNPGGPQAPGAGTGRETPSAAGGSAPVNSVHRTEFRIEFAWQPHKVKPDSNRDDEIKRIEAELAKAPKLPELDQKLVESSKRTAAEAAAEAKREAQAAKDREGKTPAGQPGTPGSGVTPGADGGKDNPAGDSKPATEGQPSVPGGNSSSSPPGR